MTTTASPRTLLRALQVTVMAGAVGLAAVACAPAGAPTAASAPIAVAATETVADAAPTTTAPAATAPAATAPTTTAPAATAPTTTAAAATAAAPGVAAGGTGTPVVGAPTAGARPIPPAPVAAAPSTAAAVRVASVLMAVVVPVAAPATTTPAGDGVAAQAARAVFDATNTFRRQNGVASLVWSDALRRSAHQHNLAMAAANQMSHQVPGERSFDTRISDQGVPWLSVGENVGFNTDRTVAGALTLHTMMINEVAPNDDHKVNKLDPKFTALGVDVYLDATTGKLWLTEDYAQL